MRFSGRPQTDQYQPALDGVRAISVIAVLLFHAGFSWMTGGYLGVSVFFTLSGFLITRLLVDERMRTGRIAARAFYARRARRLLPASIVCLVGVCAFAAFGVFDGVADLRRDVIGAVLQVANWTSLAGAGSYAQQLAAEAGQRSPLTHYWSLAIEEQFYWLWPVTIAGLATWASRGAAPVRRLAVAIGALTLAFGVAAPVIAVVWGERAAYWATPARIAEILVGALLAVALHAWPALLRNARALAAFGTACLVAIVVAFVVTPEASGFAYHGGLPLFALLSGGLLWSLQVPGALRTALGVAPLAWLGRLSYGVYLFHWPVYVLLDERRTGIDDRWALFAVRLAVTMAVSIASYWLIEHRIRHAHVHPLRVAQVALGATVVVLAAAVVLVPTTDDYYAADSGPIETIAPGSTLAPLAPASTPPGPASTATSPPATAPGGSAPSTVPGASTSGGPAPSAAPGGSTVAPATSTTSTSLVPARPVRILVVGDSTAEATGTGLLAWADAHPELATVALSVERGCGVMAGGDVWTDDGWMAIKDDCEDWLTDGVPEVARAFQPDVAMIMSTSWDVLDRRWPDTDRLTPFDPAYSDRLNYSMQALTGGLLDAGVPQVAWIHHPVADPLWLGYTTQADPARHVPIYTEMQALADADPDHVTVLDMAGWLEGKGWAQDHDVRPDGVHWSPEASTTMAEEWLGPALVRVALGGGRTVDGVG